MADKLVFMDGAKAVDLWEGDEGWTILSGAGQDTPIMDFFKFIPTLSRGVGLRMNGVGSMPFDLMKGKTVYDSSAEWENKVGFLPNPKMILQKVEASLIMAGTAYLFKEKSAAGVKMLRYHVPSSITPEIDPVRGLLFFKRPVNSVDKKFKVDDYIYFWPPDPYVEIGPARNYPAQAAANAGGVLLNVDLFASQFFKRGAIKAMLLTVQGMPIQSERDRLSDWWRQVVAGIKNAFGAQVVNADKVTPVVIGEGLKELENVTLGEEKRQDVSIALGIPMSILFANAANYATSTQDELNYLNGTIIPECEFIASVLNEQLFDDLGLHLVFKPETLDAMQEDEEQRAQALKTLTDAGFPLLMAVDILGFELTDEQRLELEQAEEERKAKAEEMQRRLQQPPTQPAAQAQEEQPQPVENAAEDMKRWERKALNALEKGNSAAVTFVSDMITGAESERISLALKNARTPEQVRHVFGGNGNGKPPPEDIKALTEALRDAALALREKESVNE